MAITFRTFSFPKGKKLIKCNTCLALLEESDADAHVSWHHDMNREN